MVIDNTSIASFLISFVRTIVNAVVDLWDFLTTPFLTINLENSLFSKVYSWVTNGAVTLGNYEISFLWFFGGTAIILLIILKLVSLVNPLG